MELTGASQDLFYKTMKRHGLELIDNLSINSGRVGAPEKIRFVGFYDVHFLLVHFRKGDGRAIAQELTDAFAVYMTDALAYEN